MDGCKQTFWRFGTPKEKNFFCRWGALVLTQEKKLEKSPDLIETQTCARCPS